MSEHARSQSEGLDPTGTDARAPFPVEIAPPASDAAPDPTGTQAAAPLTRAVPAPVEDTP